MDVFETKKYIEKQGLPSFRLRQIKTAYFREGKTSWQQVQNLPRQLRHELEQNLSWFSIKALELQQTPDHSVVKALLELSAPGGRESIESVLLRHKNHYTACVSCQVGCPVGCVFCATGRERFRRNLSAEEIVDQIVFWNNYLRSHRSGHAACRARVGNVVFMGMGEPFLNWESVSEALEIIMQRDCLGISARRISISSCGLIEKIKELAADRRQINLAISLHSALEQTRQRLIPLAKSQSLDSLLAACLEYVQKSGRKLFFEHAFFAGINDGDYEVERLIWWLKQHYLFHLNIIPYNPVSCSDLAGSSPRRIKEIIEILRRERIPHTLRRSFGRRIEAACGQLRRRREVSATQARLRK